MPAYRLTVSGNITNEVIIFDVMNTKYGLLWDSCGTQLNKNVALPLLVQHLNLTYAEKSSRIYLTTPQSFLTKFQFCAQSSASRYLCTTGVQQLGTIRTLVVMSFYQISNSKRFHLHFRDNIFRRENALLEWRSTSLFLDTDRLIGVQ